jgi:hypothetical protein
MLMGVMEYQTPNIQIAFSADVVVAVYNVTAKYLPPIVICFGFIGNILSLAVMQRSNYSKSSLWVYLRYLAVCDTGFVVTQGVQRHVSHFVPLRETLGSFFCKEYYYFAFVSAVSTCFGVTFMTIDRFIVVAWPLRATSWCTRKRAVITCVVNSVTLLILCSPQLTREMLTDANLPDRERCSMNPKWMEKPVFIFFHIGLISSPITVAILNLGIVVLIRKSRQQRTKMAATKEQQHESQMDVLLLVVSSSFCLCIWPYTIDWMAFSFFIPLKTMEQLLLRKMSYGMNFYLYCFSSVTIRKDLKAMLKFKAFRP